MRTRWFLAAGLTLLTLSGRPSANPSTWMADAIRSDIDGKAAIAFTYYRRAAEAGLPDAQFNVAVMLDSGRGVNADLPQAAVWYARAAARGIRRAAFNLGQLYEKGEGVPTNAALARAWFKASNLAAARAHIERLPAETVNSVTTVKAPIQVAPMPDARCDADADGVELVWTSVPQPKEARFFLELRALKPDRSSEIFSGFVDTSSWYAKLPRADGIYAWRVLTVAGTLGEYEASGWQQFRLVSE